MLTLYIYIMDKLLEKSIMWLSFALASMRGLKGESKTGETKTAAYELTDRLDPEKLAGIC